jgi:hypothetical protein
MVGDIIFCKGILDFNGKKSERYETTNKSEVNAQFQKEIFSLGHFHTSYDQIEHLKLQFNDQLVKLYDVGI